MRQLLSGVMKCPHCGHDDTKVVDSRPAEGQASIRRRRLCTACDERFTTYERVAPVLTVRKRDGSTQPFSADKIRKGVAAALADRPVSSGAVDGLIDAVEAEVIEAGGLLETEAIGRLVLAALKDLDQVAYVRFASVYKEFTAAADFGKELAQLELNE